jgi:hypothetical protein
VQWSLSANGVGASEVSTMKTAIRTGAPQLCEWWVVDGPADREVLRVDEQVVAFLEIDDVEGRAVLDFDGRRVVISGGTGIEVREGQRVIGRLELGRGRRARLSLASGTEARWYSAGFLCQEAGFESLRGERLVRFASDGSAIGYGEAVGSDLDLVVLLALGHVLLRRSTR